MRFVVDPTRGTFVTRVGFALFLYLIALSVRLSSIDIGDPQGDEILWLRRVTLFLQAIDTGHYATATSHLGHPGIPAVAAMALGEELNAALPRAAQFDELTAARAGNAIVSSLIAPFSYLLFSPLFGGVCGMVAALLIAFDPQNIGVSRMAHVDSTLALFVLGSTVMYLIGSVYSKPLLVVVAGVLWGGAIAGKPTALCLPAAFLVFNALYRMRSGQQTRSIIAWPDIWAVCAGLATFALLFTKFWTHHGPFLTQFQVRTELAELLYDLGSTLGAHLALVSLLSVSALVVALRSTSVTRRNLMIMTSLGVMALTLFPAVFENYARFALRLPWLAGFIHNDLGFGNPWIPGGYLGVLAFQLPSAIVPLTVIGILAFFRDWRRLSFRLATVELQAAALVLLAIATWLATLSIASRTYVRYVVPILPLVYLFAAKGLVTLCALVRSTRVRSVLPYLAALVIGGLTVWSTHPYYLNSFNSLFGGVKHAAAREYPLYNEGHEAALRFLINETANATTPKNVAVLGEILIVQKAYERINPQKRKTLTFIPAFFPQSTDYILSTEPLMPFHMRTFGQTVAGSDLVYEYVRDGARFVAVWKGRPITPSESLAFPLFGARHETGGASTEDAHLGYRDATVLYAMPERHRPGLLVSRAFLQLAAGTFQMALKAGILNRPSVPDPEAVVLTLSLGTGCSREVKASELSTAMTPIEFSCSFDGPQKAELSVRWEGVVPVVVQALEFKGKQ